MTSAYEALEWMKSKANDQGNHILFRGQNQVWPTIKPSITRLGDQARMDMWAICRHFYSVAQGVTGYHIPSEHDRLAILQHYVGRSPVIDLTATPEIALYFALQGATPNKECVVYAINRQQVATSAEVVISDHAFLTLPLNAGGLQHRWLQQDGYSIGPKQWRDLNVVTSFDLLKLPGVESKCFTIGQNDNELTRHLGNLEATALDPLARAVRGVVTAIARAHNLLTPEIANVLQAARLVDSEAELNAEIDCLISLASAAKPQSDVLTTLQSLRGAVGTQWDTSFDASLDWARGEVLKVTDAEQGDAPDGASRRR